MRALLKFSAFIDRINRFVGQQVSWLILVAVIVSTANAIIRKAFDSSSNAWLELQWYLFGAVFMLAAAYTLLMNEHIRIDVLSSNFKKSTRDKIDLVCHILFLLPFCVLMIYLCVPWFYLTWVSGEMSANAGGLILWPAKLLVLAGFIMLLAQCFSEIIKRFAIIIGIMDDPLADKPTPGIIKLNDENGSSANA
jgi:TRAP-type mannitol/chloroaromatic compound transport system permease small subunit